MTSIVMIWQLSCSCTHTHKHCWRRLDYTRKWSLLNMEPLKNVIHYTFGCVHCFHYGGVETVFVCKTELHVPFWTQSVCVLQTVQTSVSVLCGTEQLIGSLPEVKWAKQVMYLATELQEHCLQSIVTHLPQVTHTTAFNSLRRVGTNTYTHPQRLIHTPA